MATPVNRSYGLDIVRALSVWMVLAAHVAYWFSPDPGGLYHSIISPILLGVEPFFVLGGFLAAATFKRIEESSDNLIPASTYRNYIKRRWARTLPNYYLFLIIYSIAFFIFKDNFTFEYSYLIFSQNLYWLSPNFFSVSWSLATQEWFYVALPLAMYISSIVFKRGKDLILLGSMLLIVIAFVSRYSYISQFEINSLEGDIRRIALLRLDSISIGVLIGYIYFKHTVFFEKIRIKLLLMGISTTIILSYLRKVDLFSQSTEIQFIYYPLYSLSLSLFLPFFYGVTQKKIGAIQSIVTSTSKWSYSIYLCHVFYLDGLYLLGSKLGIIFDFNIQTSIIFLLWITFVYCTAFLLYKYFEMPIVKYFYRRSSNYNRRE